MKTINRYGLLAYGCITVLLALLATGCLKDTTRDLPAEPLESKKTTIRLSISQHDEVVMDTRSTALEVENRIQALRLVIYDDTGTLVLNQFIPTSQITDNGTANPSFSIVTIPELKKQWKIYLLANAEGLISTIPSSESDLSDALTYEVSSLQSEIPMYGVTTVSNDWASGEQISVFMTRVLSKVSVALANNLTNYQISEFYVEGTPQYSGVEVADDGQIARAKDRCVGWIESIRIAPAHSFTYCVPFPHSSYIGEDAIDSLKFNPKRIRLMLKLLDKTTNVRSWYRLDFGYNEKDDPFTLPEINQAVFRDILPNRHYIFNINKIHNQGYDSELEAASNPGSNLEYMIVVNDDWSQTAISNGQYLVKTDRDTTYLQLTTERLNLLRYREQMPSSIDSSNSDVRTQRVSLVGADRVTPIPTTEVQLYWNNGKEEWSDDKQLTNNRLSTGAFTDIADRGAQLKYTATADPDQEMYVKLEYGNIVRYIPVGWQAFEFTVGGSVHYRGGDVSCSMTSYAKFGSKKVPQPWKVDGYRVDGATEWSATAPAWIRLRASSGPGTTTKFENTYFAIVAARNMHMDNSHNDKLKATAPVSNYDLSTVGGTTAMNTANCYLVNAPGTYRLPLVYGNAIKNGATNTSAYISTAPAGNTILSRFLNSRGAGITDPYIYNNANCTPGDCCLVWQDTEGLVSDVKLSADNKYLEFSVPQASIYQGNAVVAVRNASKQIMWSWHIWVTDYKLGTGLQTTTNYQGVTYNFLPYNIGWCDPSSSSYPARSVQVRFTQTSKGGMQQIVTINQTAGPSYNIISGNNPYFQWGRKDPMLPGINFDDSSNSSNKWWFCGSGYAFGDSDMGTSISSYILNPLLFNIHGPMDNKYYNLWSANNTVTTANDNVVVKTVYDPSPVGFCMPPPNTWTGFTTTGNASQNQIRGTWDSTVFPAGYNFDITGGTAYFPASGYRVGRPFIYYVNMFGYWWSAGPYTTGDGRSFYFGNGYVDPLLDNHRNEALSVRSVKEQ